MSELRDIENKSFMIFAHNGGGLEGGWDDALFNFISHKNIKSLVKIDFPFGSKSKFSSIRTQKYFDNHVFATETRPIWNFSKPAILSYIKDFIYGVYFGISQKQNYDLFIGMDCLLSLAGIVLRRLGIVKKVGSCIVDFTPVRFSNPLLNKIYYSIDRYVCYNADYIFPLNDFMIEGRVANYGYDRSLIHSIEAPFGNNSDTYSTSDYESNNPRRLVYYGGVMQSKGSDLFAKICKELVNLDQNDFELYILGGGEIEALKSQLLAENVAQYVKVFGRIDAHSDAEKTLFTCGIALAPYFQDDKNSFSYYADAGKIKVYLGCGLPVIITPVPPIHSVIAKESAGLVVSYDPKEFAKAITNVWDNYSAFRANAIRIGKLYSWNAIFSNLFLKVNL